MWGSVHFRSLPWTRAGSLPFMHSEKVLGGMVLRFRVTVRFGLWQVLLATDPAFFPWGEASFGKEAASLTKQCTPDSATVRLFIVP